MAFRSYIPRDILKPYVRSIAISENEQATSYKVLPDTGLVMGFQYFGRLSYSHDEGLRGLSQAGITGLMDRYRTFHNTDHTHTVLVMFTETGAAVFFPQPMHELFGQSLSLDDLLLRSQMDVVSEHLLDASDESERIRIVEEFLVSRLNPKQKDALVNLAVSLIRRQQGNIRITQLAEQLHISQSRLEKRFRRIVGATPKKFASIVRIRSLLNKPAGEQLTQLGLEAGYFDQAHFIKDFKVFTGDTPERFFKK